MATRRFTRTDTEFTRKVAAANNTWSPSTKKLVTDMADEIDCLRADKLAMGRTNGVPDNSGWGIVWFGLGIGIGMLLTVAFIVGTG